MNEDMNAIPPCRDGLKVHKFPYSYSACFCANCNVYREPSIIRIKEGTGICGRLKAEHVMKDVLISYLSPKGPSEMCKNCGLIERQGFTFYRMKWGGLVKEKICSVERSGNED